MQRAEAPVVRERPVELAEPAVALMEEHTRKSNGSKGRMP